MDLFAIAPQFYWMIGGITLLILEVFTISGIGFLFTGLGCLVVFLLMQFQLIEHNLLFEFSIFFTATILFWLILWIPLRKMLKTANSNEYKDMLGSTAQVYQSPLTSDKTGQVLWSGVIMKAKLDSAEENQILPVGTQVVVTKVKGNVLHIKRITNK